MRILNGRTLGDSMGKLTCHERGGSSVVDYAIVHQSIIDEVHFFHVHDFIPDLSDHCMISFALCARYTISKSLEVKCNTDLKSCEFVWNESGGKRFVEHMKSAEVYNSLQGILEDAEYTNVDCKIEGICDILVMGARKTLHKKSFSKKKKTGAKWFDTECYEMRKDVVHLSKK